MPPKPVLITLVHALAGWALCGATMALGMASTSISRALVFHAIAAPVIFFIVSWVYFTRFRYWPPLQTAAIFVTFVIAMDFFVVALLIQKNFEMFRSFLGTWLPFLLIFLSSWLTGRRFDRILSRD